MYGLLGYDNTWKSGIWGRKKKSKNSEIKDKLSIYVDDFAAFTHKNKYFI